MGSRGGPVTRSIATMSGTSVILGCFAAAASSACWTAKPVASATWTIRRWLCPPSRVRCSASPSIANGTPSSIRCGDRARRRLDDMLDDASVVEPRAGDHRIVDVRLEAVAFVEHRGDPALRASRRAFAQSALGDHRDRVRFGEVERRRQPSRARADDEDVGGRAHAASTSAETRLRNTSSRSGSRVETSTIDRPSAASELSTWPAFTWSLR